jgi:hypothetical protein
MQVRPWKVPTDHCLAAALEIEAYLGRDPAVAGTRAAQNSSTTAAAWTKPAEEGRQRSALAKEWRRKIADGWRKIYVIENILEVDGELHAITLSFGTSQASKTLKTAATTTAAPATARSTHTAAASGYSRHASACSPTTAATSLRRLTCLLALLIAVRRRA